jgi:hypothetical protein
LIAPRFSISSNFTVEIRNETQTCSNGADRLYTGVAGRRSNVRHFTKDTKFTAAHDRLSFELVYCAKQFNDEV